MRHKTILSELMMSFFVTSTCISICMGVLGTIFLKDDTLGYDAYFLPVIFGFITISLGFFNYTKKEISIGQAIVRKAIHLLLIECFIFGINYFSGTVFKPILAIWLAISIAVVYVVVNLITWLNDKRVTTRFNRELEVFQQKEG